MHVVAELPLLTTEPTHTYAGSGDGSVELSSEGPYAAGTPVTLTAIPDPGDYFDHWSGDVPLENRYDDEIVIIMDSDKNITAWFKCPQ